ncbi:KdsC family phosphatase [Candidatus Omnitrophota bacterium]
MKSIRAKAKKIKVLILDVDGVLTNGKIVFDNTGREMKFFDVQDGLGVIILKRAGIKTFIITARSSPIVTKRARDMQVFKTYQDARDKLQVYKRIAKDMKLTDSEICFVGDELIDLSVMKKAGLAIAVSNAVPEVKKVAGYITKRSGGAGAVREVIELILKSQDKWKKAIRIYQ